ncbi:MAG: hypothetical protein LUG85_06655 [Clostridiales bacterium]|nr:hypothetical protein [Clostridiales bacterium]MCD7828199.1 hypothetical protein [Clostridiales bacterium]
MKKILPILLTFILVVGIILGTVHYMGTDKLRAYVSGFTFDDDFNEDNIPLSTYYYDRLDENEKTAYINILNRIKSHPAYIKIPTLTTEEFNNVFFAVKNDNPNLLCFSDSCNMTVYMSVCLLELHYDHTAEECDAMCSELQAKANEILSSMPEELDNYEKELYIHDYIVSNCEYESCDGDSTAYGCLINGKAVCSGYSRAAMLLLQEAGIESVLIGGTGISDSQGSISHMWNAVWIDGEPYQLDVTWDDPTGSDSTYISHMYFNITSEDISSDHINQDPDIECTAVSAEYFVREGMHFYTYDSATLLAIEKKLVENIENGLYYVEFKFFDENAYETAVEELFNTTDYNSDIYNIIKYVSSYANDLIDISHINFSQNDDLRYIKLMFDAK